MSSVVFNLEKILQDKNMSRRELSRLTQIRPGTINDICNNEIKLISVHYLGVICTTLDIAIEELITIHK